jgi:membrane fusion protein
MIMIKQPLFRPEVLLHAKQKQLGLVFINTPLPYVFAMAGSVICMLSLIAFVIWGEFSEKWTVTGFVNASEGVTHAYARQRGVIKKSYVKQGVQVKRGDILFILDTADDGLDDTQVTKTEQSLQIRMQALKKALVYKQRYLNKLTPLLHKKYISTTFYDTKRDEILALKSQNHQLEMELIRYKQSRISVIKAPIDGRISSVMGFVGQQAQVDKPLVSILPKNTTYVAQLYIPVNKAGFLNVHDVVTIHYDAYPYQRFGVGTGVIQSLSQTVLTDQEENKPIQIKQPYYKGIATLEKPYLWVYGKPRLIQQGMTFTAVVLGAKKTVWQWILDPLYSHSREALTS